MMRSQPKKIAVVGIDGCGKSTVIQRFQELSPVPKTDVKVLNCPLYHETPNAPLAKISRELDAFSQAADSLGNFELKASALFLQMTLFGPVETSLLDTFRPRFLLCERHAIVDSLAYGPFYGRMIQGAVDARTWEIPLESKLSEFRPGTLASILHWHELENRRLGRMSSLWEIPADLLRMFNKPWGSMLDELALRYRTALPDVILLLDVPAAVAQKRVTARSNGNGELHEKTTMLDSLRQSYHNVVEVIGQEHPEIEVHIIDTGSGNSIDETLYEVLDRAGLSVKI